MGAQACRGVWAGGASRRLEYVRHVSELSRKCLKRFEAVGSDLKRAAARVVDVYVYIHIL